jgi:hypothetical protein
MPTVPARRASSWHKRNGRPRDALVETTPNLQDVRRAFGRILTESLDTQHRVERVIRECHELGIEPDPRTVAEIMVDDDVTRDKYENLSAEWRVAFAEYEKGAERALKRISEPSRAWGKRRRA